jgi:hypothetical protein
MPIARLAHETVHITLFALIGFALLRWAAKRWQITGLQAALGAAGA